MTGLTLTARLAFPFLVVRKGKSLLPRFRHATMDEATDEAQRRATERPGETYLVLQEVLRVQSKSAQAPRVDEPGGNVPRRPAQSGRAG